MGGSGRPLPRLSDLVDKCAPQPLFATEGHDLRDPKEGNGLKLLRARKTAFSPRKLIWRRLSMSDHTPLAVESPKCAPQPLFATEGHDLRDATVDPGAHFFHPTTNLDVGEEIWVRESSFPESPERASVFSGATVWVSCGDDLTKLASLWLSIFLSRT